MDKHFMAIIAIGAIALGALGIVCGTALIIVTGDIMAGATCIGIGTTVIGTLGGVMIAPKQFGVTATVATEPPAEPEKETETPN